MARTHYIAEWAAEAGVKPATIVKKIGVDKANVSRWLHRDVIPSEKYLAPLAELFGLPEPAALFVHPAEYKILLEIRELAGRASPAA